MVAPAVSTTAQELFDGLGAWKRADGEATSWHLLLLCDAVTQPLDYVETLVRDNAQGIGWSELFDADRVPAEGAGYLGQMVGVALPVGLDLATERAYIKATGGFNRGSVTSVKGAPAPYLTGTKKVVLKERTLGAYYFTVITYLAETPDSASVLAALVAQKPAGMVMTYTVQSGPSVNQLVGSINAQVGTINHYAAVVP